MKKLLSLALLLSVIGFVSSCGDKGKEEPTPTVAADTVLKGTISKDMKLTADKIWVLDGRVIVSGATLTIEAGTIVKGKTGTGNNASVLMIARGGKLNAKGTAEKPIIFTSELDNIKKGEKKGTNLKVTDSEKWGGLVILGKAPISADEGDTEAQIEGVDAGEKLGLYGGSEASDNSGVIEYVSIRHGGTEIAKGNEINGLTLGGVGSGTSIKYVEIYGGKDDGVEFFGGTVNVTNIMVNSVGDDAIDVDQNFSGTVDNFVVMVEKSKSDKALEIDGPEGKTNTDGKVTLKNGTVYSVNGATKVVNFKSKAQGTVSNVLFKDYTSGKFSIRASYDKSKDCAEKTDAFKNLKDGKLTFEKIQFDNIKVDVYTESSCKGAPEDDKISLDAETKVAAEKIKSATATGADEAKFAWTATKSK